MAEVSKTQSSSSASKRSSLSSSSSSSRPQGASQNRASSSPSPSRPASPGRVQDRLSLSKEASGAEKPGKAGANMGGLLGGLSENYGAQAVGAEQAASSSRAPGTHQSPIPTVGDAAQGIGRGAQWLGSKINQGADFLEANKDGLSTPTKIGAGLLTGLGRFAGSTIELGGAALEGAGKLVNGDQEAWGSVWNATKYTAQGVSYLAGEGVKKLGGLTEQAGQKLGSETLSQLGQGTQKVGQLASDQASPEVQKAIDSVPGKVSDFVSDRIEQYKADPAFAISRDLGEVAGAVLGATGLGALRGGAAAAEGAGAAEVGGVAKQVAKGAPRAETAAQGGQAASRTVLDQALKQADAALDKKLGQLPGTVAKHEKTLADAQARLATAAPSERKGIENTIRNAQINVDRAKKALQDLARDKAALQSNPRLRELAVDPNTGTFDVAEARLALRAEGQGKVEGLKRAIGTRSTENLGGGDFVDAKGKVWDAVTIPNKQALERSAFNKVRQGENLLVDRASAPPGLDVVGELNRVRETVRAAGGQVGDIVFVD